MRLDPICFEVPFEVWYRFEKSLGLDNIPVPLDQVPVEDLVYLVDMFREQLFETAHKIDPSKSIPVPRESVIGRRNPYTTPNIPNDYPSPNKWVGKRDPKLRVTYHCDNPDCTDPLCSNTAGKVNKGI